MLWYNIEVDKKAVDDLGVAQLVARYLGVVEAASSSLVTQTKIRRNCTNSYGFFFLFLLMFNIFFGFSFLIRLKVHTKYIQPMYVHVFGKVCTNSIRKTSKSLINQGFSALASTFCGGRGLNLRPLLIFAMIKFIGYNSK